MSKRVRVVLCALLCAIITVASVVPVVAAEKIVTDPTGYTSASDVEYKKVSGYIVNWGARGEDCIFLSTYAQNYYVGNYTFEVLSDNGGGTNQSDAPNSALYNALKNMMKAEHSYIISYQSTRPLYRYTDCLKNDTDHISSFYSGKELNGTWDSGATWNREHTWPNSKGLGGSDEDDIMMIRPTWVSENSSRGNTAYGEGSGYYDPGESVRGDCARIALYVYVRWGNTSRMWGTSGVIQNLDTLLRWMEEDPVDTWEMGRNDAVESITGVRNVFVDYPEYAWLLFGQEVPEDMSTPSGLAQSGINSGNNNDTCKHTDTKIVDKKNASCTENGYTGDTFCVDCRETLEKGTPIAATGHQHTELQGVVDPTCAPGYDGDMVCKDCGTILQQGQMIPAVEEHNFGDWNIVEEPTETMEGLKERMCTVCKVTESVKISVDDTTSTEEDTTIEDTTIEDTTIEDTQEGNSEDQNSEEQTTEGQGNQNTEGNNSQGNPSDENNAKPYIVGAAIVVPSAGIIGAVVAVLKKRSRG
ncbi:MAG: endonuclease [Agathobacter sp.]|nr:endonuclease [Agathobacter sp.]